MTDGWGGPRPRALIGVKHEYVTELETKLAEFETATERLTQEGNLLREQCANAEGARVELKTRLSRAEAAVAHERARRYEVERAHEESLGQLRAVSEERDQVGDRVAGLERALAESFGWVERLPFAIWELNRLAAGQAEADGLLERIGEAVHEAVGRHLLTSVEFGECPHQRGHQQTDRDEDGTLLRTRTEFGGRRMTCEWRNGLNIDPEGIAAAEALCYATLLSLAGHDEATVRDARGILTQLGDSRALSRHLALRERIGEPSVCLRVCVDENSANTHRKLFGEIAWEASFADAGAALEEIAHRYGGQTYQLGRFTFSMVVDAAHAELARADATLRLADSELTFSLSEAS